MPRYDNIEYLRGLLNELRQLPRETEWVEFKRDNADLEEIGEYISALANSAALEGKSAAYLVWGVADDSHEIVGTIRPPRRSEEGQRGTGELARTLAQPAHPLPPHRVGRGRPARIEMIEIPAGSSPAGPVSGDRVHPRRLVQEEAQGPPRARARALARLRRDAISKCSWPWSASTRPTSSSSSITPRTSACSKSRSLRIATAFCSASPTIR
jgi:predicted HTH transcriptional regulator